MNTKSALIIIDVQNDFLPGGALAVSGGDAVIAPITALTEQFDTIVLTQDWHPAGHKSFASSHENAAPFSLTQMSYGDQVLWPDHCVQGTAGAALALPEAVLNKAALILRKGMNPEIDSYSAFAENDKTTQTGLTGWLFDREIEEVVIVGLALDYCVAFSALDAAKTGFKVAVITSAARAIAPDTEAAQIAAMTAAGVEIRAA